MLIVGYQEWMDRVALDLQSENPVIECPVCHDHFWPGCDECDFEGEFNALDAPERVIEGLLSKKAYQDQVIEDLKKWCSYTRTDFLFVVAPFIQNFRDGNS